MIIQTTDGGLTRAAVDEVRAAMTAHQPATMEIYVALEVRKAARGRRVVTVEVNGRRWETPPLCRRQLRTVLRRWRAQKAKWDEMGVSL